jgi:phage terminase large subunit-like protein
MADPRQALAEQVALLPKAERTRILDALGAHAATIVYDWRFWARPTQYPPLEPGWRVWVVMAGRGFGKTRTGAEFIRALAEEDAQARLALIGTTYAQTRAVMVEGESGLLNICPPWAMPNFEPSNRRLLWPNGAQAFLYSAEEPEALRGPQHQAAWCDELGKWPQAERLWANLWLGLRLSQTPQVVVTTTPRPMPLLRQLLGEKGTVVTRGTTRDNAAYLPPAFLHAVEARYAGTLLGRQELLGELIEALPGALWTREGLEATRVHEAAAALVPRLLRVVVGVDPPLSVGENADACGIVVAGIDADGHGYVLSDESVQGLSPHGWAQAVVRAYTRWQADRLVVEINAGGALVETLLRGIAPHIAIKNVHARRAKALRAEPVAALYERGLVHHVRGLPELEDEMCSFTNQGHTAGHSPDRVDALVWALGELMLLEHACPQVRML